MKELEIEKETKVSDSPVVLDFYTIEQLMMRLGASENYIRKMVRTKKLIGARVGKRLIFSAGNVQAFIKLMQTDDETDDAPVKVAKQTKVKE